MEKEVYVLVKCCSGEDYEVDSPEVIGVYSTVEKVNEAMAQEVEEHLKWCGDNKIDTIDGDGYFEITDFDADEHIVLRVFMQKVI